MLRTRLVRAQVPLRSPCANASEPKTSIAATTKIEFRMSVDRVGGSVGLQHFLAVDDHRFLSVDETDRRAGLRGTNRNRNLVAGLEHLLGPAGPGEDARAVHFDGPVD